VQEFYQPDPGGVFKNKLLGVATDHLVVNHHGHSFC